MNDSAFGKAKRRPHGKYQPNNYPVLTGKAKCAKKGHCPKNESGRCSRCGVYDE